MCASHHWEITNCNMILKLIHLYVIYTNISARYFQVQLFNIVIKWFVNLTYTFNKFNKYHLKALGKMHHLSLFLVPILIVLFALCLEVYKAKSNKSSGKKSYIHV